MKAGFRFALAAGAAAASIASAAAATTGPTVVEAGGAAYPDRAYILSLPTPKLLTRSDVTVTENGGSVSKLSVSHQGSSATTSEVVLAIDASASMAGRPSLDALRAARAFARRMSADQKVAIVTFNDKVDVLQGFTSDKSKVLDALGSQPKLAVGTKIYDGLDKAVGLFDVDTPAASIVLLSDGRDVGSSVPARTVLTELRQRHVRVFSVGLASPSSNAAGLQRIASASRGRYVAAATPGQLTPIFATLGRQLSSEYLLRYRSRVNPLTHVDVRVVVRGVPGAATSSYTTPPLHLTPVGAYQPSAFDRVVQSTWTMIGVALALALLVGWAVSHVTKSKNDALVERVAGFVTVQHTGGEERGTRTQEERVAQSLLARMRAASGSRGTSDWSERLRASLELADVQLEPIQLVAFTLLGTILVMVVFGALLGAPGVLLGLATPLVVRAWVRRRVARKRTLFAEQLPDNLDVLASALRAGHSLVSALSVVANDAVEPAKSEFQRVIAEEQFGANVEDAFQIAVERMDNYDLDQVALVARLQREVGSNSAEVLDRVVETVRARMELRRLIQTLTAQGRFSRWVLTALPVGLALILMVLGHDYMHPLVSTGVGRLMLLGSALMVALGSWLIGRIVDIKI